MISDEYDPQIATGTVENVAVLTGIPVGTLLSLRQKNPKESPPFFKVGRSVRYRITGPDSVESWIEQKIAAAQQGGPS